MNKPWLAKTVVISLSIGALLSGQGQLASASLPSGQGITEITSKSAIQAPVALAVRMQREAKSLEGNSGSKPEFQTVKTRIKELDSSWLKTHNYTDAETWCAWTASFLLRGKNFAGSKEIYDPSTSNFLRKVAKASPGGKIKIVFTAKLNGTNANLQKALNSKQLMLQPGDLFAYFKPENYSRVRALLDNPSSGTDRPFEHLGVVVNENKFVEGNRGYKFKVFTKSSAEYAWYGGLVIIRPSWKD